MTVAAVFMVALELAALLFVLRWAVRREFSEHRYLQRVAERDRRADEDRAWEKHLQSDVVLAMMLGALREAGIVPLTDSPGFSVRVPDPPVLRLVTSPSVARLMGERNEAVAQRRLK